MELIIHISFSRTLINERLNYFQLLSTARFKTTGIMNDETWVASKYDLILDVMDSALQQEDIVLMIKFEYTNGAYFQGWIDGQ